ncbi:MAG: aminotransferase class V-fold PLP-dependent enzyme, partial [Rhizobiaceae bacterium]|nr:aminotransferase class V-fold PLP-dependent enzyme [Rhizobiaceae bacterium]
RDVARLVGARAEHVVFTSGATEAANHLLTPNWTMGRAPLRLSRLHVAQSDHPCLRNGGRFAPADIERLPVDRDGLVDVEIVAAALARRDAADGPALVALHAANNETGVVQPFAEIGAVVKAAGGIFVIDAVQAVGRIPFDIAASGADFVMLSGHKIGGPQGVGAIVGASDLMMPSALLTGGGQEKGHRGGSENVAAIAGFGAAAKKAAAALAEVDAISALRDRTEALVRAAGGEIVAASAPRLPNTVCFALPGLKAETAQIAFDLEGIALSAGSACSSGKVSTSHVLAAMGRGELGSALRLSIGAGTMPDDIALFAAALERVTARRREAVRAA